MWIIETRSNSGITIRVTERPLSSDFSLKPLDMRLCRGKYNNGLCETAQSAMSRIEPSDAELDRLEALGY